MADKKPSGIYESIKTIVYALLIALVVRTIAFEPFNIPSGSMLPTLEIGDYLFVSKYSYGYSRHSLPLSLPLIPGRIFFSNPEQGDVAVFKLPSDNQTDYIKRIVGMPCDRIQMKFGRLHINGKSLKRRKVQDYSKIDSNGRYHRITRYLETLPNGKEHAILEVSDQGPLDNTGVYIVPEGHYFAMGDNRDNSQDSRVLPQVGFIPKENLVGRAEILFFSTNNKARWWEIWKWFGAMRVERFFQGIN